ncbi:FitA-like ribbon-helix-helix domain-containing protein [Streptomyces griseorubiginosus]|uniref:FitA-like ribbon-helix-helix domain-containing protein n=1 Tax=Streptomyces griseorubiginosus TaxID=67304 RepID=UPI001AD6E59B|nr:antitoxin [Streptomyces griseorubiginosus]MBO4257579.1 antitoxin [Streptomyces griseorubiginosus]
MTTAFTVRDVPDDIARTIKIRAAEAGQSLQGYLLGLILREASKPSLAEMAARAERYASDEVDHEDVLAALDEGRRGR